MAGCFPGVSEWLHVWMDGGKYSSESSVMLILPPSPTHVSDVTCNPADAAHADAAVPAPQWREAQASSRRGSRRTSAKVSGAEQSSSNKMQTEEKSVGDVFREESGRAHSDQHAASGT